MKCTKYGHVSVTAELEKKVVYSLCNADKTKYGDVGNLRQYDL